MDSPAQPPKPDQSSSATSPTLLENLRRENQEAWLRLVECYSPRLLDRCRTRGLDFTAAQDVLQETWLSVSKSIGKFESPPGRGAFRAWLHRILLRRIADYRRREDDASIVSGGHSVVGQLPEPFDSSLSTGVFDDFAVLGSFQPGHRNSSFLETSPSNDASSQLLSHIATIRRSIDEKTWKIFIRAVIDAVASDVVAKEFSVTPANVRQIRSRILRKLREYRDGPK